MNIGFHSDHLKNNEMGDALFNYALYNESILDNKSVIISDVRQAVRREEFEDKFVTELYSLFLQVDSFVDKHKLDAIFYIKSGENDGKIIHSTVNWIQATQRIEHPHGQAYFYNSPWLGDRMGNKPWLPWIVTKLPDIKEDYREFLNISKEDVVFGFYGDGDSFNIPFVHRTIERVVQSNKQIHFIFMNVPRFSSLENIHHVTETSDAFKKSALINTCDAMIYGTESGETFGLNVADFSVKNKPIVCYANSAERHHINMIRDSGLYYRTQDELYYILTHFKTMISPNKNYDFYSEYYSPLNVMTTMDKLLIDTLRK